ncbi:hypothetical protein [Sigmofec virus UA08Rod_6125]|uniref:Nonstructural protein n=1 Tax=Sigmofec virus UA08Rod_6125 TaxID=2929454 RepID=A0A976N1S2_9VIRU|nr:hypothetical protein [Sigmofec virus UA08Rod_6125]
MKIKIYATKDTVIGAYMKPFYMHNDMEAQRSFALAMQDENSENRKIAKDLQLYRIGEFDDETGEIKPDCEYLAKGSDYIKSEKGE